MRVPYIARMRFETTTLPSEVGLCYFRHFLGYSNFLPLKRGSYPEFNRKQQDHHGTIFRPESNHTPMSLNWNERNTGTVVFQNIYTHVRAGEIYRKSCSCVRAVRVSLFHLRFILGPFSVHLRSIIESKIFT